METLDLNTHWNVSESLNWTVSHAIKELLSNAVDRCPDKTTVTYLADKIIIKNTFDQSMSKGIEKASFTYRSNPDNLIDRTVSGKFGYGLKDAIAILYAYGIEYKAITAHGTFTVNKVPSETIKVVHDTSCDTGVRDGHVEQHLSLFPYHSRVPNETKRMTFDDLVGETRQAKSKIIVFTEDIKGMRQHKVLEKDGMLIGSIYYMENNGHYETSPLVPHLYIHNIQYNLKEHSSVADKEFLFVYNLAMDKKRQKNRDRNGIPLGWQHDILKLVKMADEEVFGILARARSRAEDVDRIYELHTHNIMEYVNKFHMLNERERSEKAVRDARRNDEREKLEESRLEAEADLAQHKKQIDEAKHQELANFEVEQMQKKLAQATKTVKTLKRKAADLEEDSSYSPMAMPKPVVWLHKDDLEVVDPAGFTVMSITNARSPHFDKYPSHHEYIFMFNNGIDLCHFRVVRALQNLLHSLSIFTCPIRAAEEQQKNLVEIGLHDKTNIYITVKFTDVDTTDDAFSDLLKCCYVAMSEVNFQCMLNKTPVECVAELAVRTLSCVAPDLTRNCCGVVGDVFQALPLVVRSTFCPLLVATEWDTKSGGISAYNIQLAKGLASKGIDVYVLVLSNICSDEDVTAAREQGVHVVEASILRKRFYPVLNGQERKITHVIGHAHITGSEAAQISKLPYLSHSKLWQFNHVIPTRVDRLKDRLSFSERHSSGEDKDTEIRALNEAADFVWSVGRDMFNCFDSSLPPEKHAEIILPLNPFYLTEPTQKTSMNPKNVIIQFVGRAENVYFVKGMDLALRACGDLAAKPGFNEKYTITLKIRGIPVKDREAVYARIPTVNRSANVDFLGFGSQNDVRNDLQRADVFVMPSRCEPFGLVATEAIACGVPTLVSANSGVATLLKEINAPNWKDMVVETSLYNPESDTSGLLQADVDAWAKALQRVIVSNEDAFANADMVRNCLKSHIDSLNTYDRVVDQGVREL